MNKILLAAAALVAVNSATAAVKVSGIFSDDMVLQRGKPVPVWGTAEPDEEVMSKVLQNLKRFWLKLHTSKLPSWK